MKTYITSDLHFSHSNILKFNPRTRPYTDVEHMNQEMVRIWNETVNPEDTVYILGDFAFSNPTKATNFAASLTGRKILIRGNHDHKLVEHAAFRDQFMSIHEYLEIVFNGIKVCMFHYPILEWSQCHRGSVHLHGHLHGAPSGLEQYRVRDAGVDATGNIVTPMDDMVADALKGELRVHGHVKSVVDSGGHFVPVSEIVSEGNQ